MPPLSEPELMRFNVGGRELALEAFNTDGLRTLVRTMDGRIPNMRERTLRYPGHIDYIRELQRTGTLWTPDAWSPFDDEDEFTIMRISVSGSEKFSYTLFAGYDAESGLSSMSRATGYACTGVARCVLDGTYRRSGISPPSYIGIAPGCVNRIFAHLRERDIVLVGDDGSPGEPR
jgi:saccharopine dehydrogenase-like NADP-dependent oxidoreductase